MAEPTPIPWSDRGFTSQEEFDSYVQRLKAKKGLAPVRAARIAATQTKDEIGWIIAPVAAEPSAPVTQVEAPKPTPKVKPTERAAQTGGVIPNVPAPKPVDLNLQLGKLKEGMEAVNINLPPQDVVEPVTFGAKVLSRPRTPTGTVAPGWWASLVDTPEDQWGPDWLRPQVLVSSEENTARKEQERKAREAGVAVEEDPLLTGLGAVTTATGPITAADLEPSTIEGPVGVLGRGLMSVVSGGVGVLEDLAHGAGFGEHPESGGVVERIKKGEGIMGGARDLASYAANKMWKGKPEPVVGPTPEWKAWKYNADATGVTDLDAEPKLGRPDAKWLGWYEANKDVEDKRNLLRTAATGLGFIGDLMVPVDLGAVGRVITPLAEAKATLSAIHAAEDAAIAGKEAAKIPMSARIYRSLQDTLNAVPTAVRGAMSKAPLAEDARLLAVERVATHPDTVSAVEEWTDAVRAASKDKNRVPGMGGDLALSEESTAKLQRIGLPLNVDEAEAMLRRVTRAHGGTPMDVPFPEDIARAAVGNQLVEAVKPTARNMARIGNVFIPSKYLPEVRQAVLDSPVGKLIEDVRRYRTRPASGAMGNMVLLDSDKIHEIVQYFQDSKVERRIPSRVRGLALQIVNRGPGTFESVRVPVADWNATVALATEVEARRILAAAREASPESGLALYELKSPEARRAADLAVPEELRLGPATSTLSQTVSSLKDRFLTSPDVLQNRKYVSPVVQEWMGKAASRLASVDEGIKGRVAALRAEGLPIAEAYNIEFADTWTLPPAEGKFAPPAGMDSKRLATDAVAASYGSVLGQGVNLPEVMKLEAANFYRLVAALAESPNNAVSKIADRLALVPKEEVYNYTTRIIALPAVSDKMFGQLVSLADVKNLTANALARWGLDARTASAVYEKAQALEGRFIPADSMEVATTLHVNRRAAQAATEAVRELQAVLPSSVPSPSGIFIVARDLDRKLKYALDIVAPWNELLTQPHAMVELSQDFITAVKNRLMHEVLPVNELVDYPLLSEGIETRKLIRQDKLDKLDPDQLQLLEMCVASVEDSIYAEADAFVAAMHSDLGQLASKQVADATVKELQKSLDDAVHGRPDMPLAGIESVRTLNGLAQPEMEARLASMLNVIDPANLKALPHISAAEVTPILGGLATKDVVQGLDKMGEVNWGAGDWTSTALLRQVKGGLGQILPWASGLLRAGMLGGFVVPNLAYHLVNVLSAPALMWQTVGGKLTRSALSWEATQALKYLYGKVGGLPDDAASLKELFRTPGGVPYTARDVAEIVTTQGISKSQSSFELSREITADVMRWTGQAMKGQGPEAVSYLRDFAWRNFDPRTTNYWSQIAEACDQTFRTGVLVAALKAGKTEEEAIQLARASLFDYSNLTKFERDWIAHNVLFYSFLRHNVVTSTKAILDNPSRAAHLLRLTQGLPEQILESDKRPEEVWARRMNTNDFADSKPFLFLVNNTEAKKRYAVSGPSIPFADANAQLVEWISMFTGPPSDPTLTGAEAFGAVGGNVATEVVGKQGPVAQFLWGMATGTDVSFGQPKGIAGSLDPKILYWIDMLPGGWDTFKAQVHPQETPPDRVNTDTMTAFHGKYWSLPKGDDNAARAWYALLFAATALSVKRGASQFVPMMEQARGLDMSREDVTPGQSLKLNLQPGIDTGLLEALRNIGAVAVTAERTPSLGQGQTLPDVNREAFQLEQNREAKYGTFGYPEVP